MEEKREEDRDHRADRVPLHPEIEHRVERLARRDDDAERAAAAGR